METKGHTKHPSSLEDIMTRGDMVRGSRVLTSKNVSQWSWRPSLLSWTQHLGVSTGDHLFDISGNTESHAVKWAHSLKLPIPQTAGWSIMRRSTKKNRTAFMFWKKINWIRSDAIRNLTHVPRRKDHGNQLHDTWNMLRKQSEYEQIRSEASLIYSISVWKALSLCLEKVKENMNMLANSTVRIRH